MPDRFSDGARRVRAKVYVAEVGRVHRGTSSGPSDWNHQTPAGQPVLAERVRFQFVNGNDPDSENAKFWAASPEAQPIEMTIANPGAQGIFQPGQEYYLDFVEAVRTAGD